VLHPPRTKGFGISAKRHSRNRSCKPGNFSHHTPFMGNGPTKAKAKSKRAERGLLARPLDSLFFLLPLIVFYEAVCLMPAASEWASSENRVVAFYLLQTFFEWFGTDFAWMPGLAVVAILLATHAVSREPWRFRGKAVALMYLEAVAWALPLFAMNHVTRMAAGYVSDYTWMSQAALCVGAGIYEELVFRLVLISVIVVIGADLLRFGQEATLVAAVFISAVLFALHHHPPFGGEPFEATRFTFRGIAGIYLGAIFVFRGYGPATGAHVAHNLIVLALG